METFFGLDNVPSSFSASYVTIGNFDGVHLGHQKIVTRVVELARRHSGSSVVLTFHPHPRKILFPNLGLKRLFLLEDQSEQFTDLGLDRLVLQPFSRALSELSPLEFIRDYVCKSLKPSSLIVGHDFSFGANRSGTQVMLGELSQKFGFRLEIIPAVSVGDVIVSSSVIRQSVESGDVVSAKRYLGRHFYLKGMVEKGAQRGRRLGFPTANLMTTAETLPKFGVYATRSMVGGKWYLSVTNVGLNPTFEGEPSIRPKIETHFLETSEDTDIYGELLRVEFVEFLRAEQKFNGPHEIKIQIQEDISRARELLKQRGFDGK